jgi:hypothetical protein
VQPQARINTEMMHLIEQGITLDILHGSVVAWRFLAAHGVPDEIILRVLSEPSQRRASDTQVAHQATRAVTPAEAFIARCRLPTRS